MAGMGDIERDAGLREARADAIGRRMVGLRDNYDRTLPLLLDDLEAIDRQHAAETALAADVAHAEPARTRRRART